MRIGVLGAGAIGGFVGGCLLATEAEVTFVGRAARGAAWLKDGLRLILTAATTSSSPGELSIPMPSLPSGHAMSSS
ncbi:ketopantoate reductase family protein [Ensifer adhaerens]|uniref:ketopantoate reductase family protein n=1 Tax=Ensifer adhaerens TaxID=106592 RepID=UPI002285D517|nr:2-dehydropantoate 2-reductase N-terminal domain-containing protein [Ensifer adhaerens]